ncbi:PaaI family thioesterase [Comamonas piscis]|uniref:PaaI family thioesterase n=1 Tax=Comamonas piscis TaxID=1562974 RepID=A0A7G5EBY7_9BURK|nr:PaaI family thioesterase [Comamonas piscis]QMV71512.1 PaaI family thioesterase [Comamonas piscis]WSO34224.1 PaaI family thioesterase [Comamonas piscis]
MTTTAPSNAVATAVTSDIPAYTVDEPANQIFGLSMAMAESFLLKGEAIGNDRAQVRMPYQKQYTNSRGDMHGGAIATLLDVGLSCAARAHDPLRYGVITVDLTIHYIAPGAGDVVCTAVCEKRGKSLSFVRGELHDDAGHLLGLATGTFKLVDKQKI